MKKIIYILTFLICINLVSAINGINCVPSTNVLQGGEITCSVDLAGGNAERNLAENMTFWNDTAQTVLINSCTFAGTTEDAPSPADLIHTCTIPATFGTSTTAVVNFSLPSLGTSIITHFNITSASNFDLLIDEIFVPSSCLVGINCPLKWTVKRATTLEPVLGAECVADILENVNGTLEPRARSSEQKIISGYKGHVLTNAFPTSASVKEGGDYILEIRCQCLFNSETGACSSHDTGLDFVNSTSGSFRGIGTGVFSIGRWLTITTHTDKSIYEMKKEIFISVNATNVESLNRISFDVLHQIRCSQGADNDQDLDRNLIISDDDEPDKRGVDTAISQMQGKRFKIPEAKYLQGNNNECYASTVVIVKNTEGVAVISYATTSAPFNITSDELNLQVDWEQIDKYKFNSIVNLSSMKYQEYNGQGIGNIDIRLDKHNIDNLNSAEQSFGDELHFVDMLISKNIKNITVRNLSGAIMNHRLEYLEDGYLEIEVYDTDITTSAWLNITLELESFNERQTDALEGIETKTGTFAFDFSIPFEIDRREDFIPVILSAQVEEPDIDFVNAQFECFIKDHRSETLDQFAHGVNSSFPFISTRTLLLPDSLGASATVTCKIGEKSLGTFIESASKSFFIKDISQSSDVVDGIAELIPSNVTNISLVPAAEEEPSFIEKITEQVKETAEDIKKFGTSQKGIIIIVFMLVGLGSLSAFGIVKLVKKNNNDDDEEPLFG